MSDKTSLSQALAKLDEAMRPSLGGSTDPARRRAAQRLAQLARCEDEDLPAFATRHIPGRTVEESGLRAARDLLLAIGGIADMEEGGPDAWAALAEVKRILERRLAEVKEAALKRKAEAEDAGSGKDEKVTDVVDVTAPQPGAIEPESVAGLRPGGDISKMPSYLVPLGVASKPPEPLSGIPHAQDPSAPSSRRGGPDAPRLPPCESPFRASNQVATGVHPGDPLGMTVNAVPAPPKHSLPFQSITSAAAQKLGHAEGSPASEDFNPNATIDPERVAPRGPALPFAPSGLPSTQGPRPGVPEPPRLDPRPPVDENRDEMTRLVQIPMGPVLPFRPSVEGHGARPSSPPPVEPAPRAGVAEPLHVLSLAQYASLCVELAVFPEEAEGIFRRYGLDAGEKRSAIDAAWKERLRNEPAEYEAWQELYRRYHAHWAKQR